MDQTRCYGCMKLKSPGDICEHCGYDQRQGNAPHQLPAGTVLKEQYLIGRVLGQGGFGITYLGWDLYLDIPVAVKEYYPTGTVMRETSITMDVASCGDEAGVRFRNNKERFLREAKMLARFSQVPEIVQVRNFFLANNTAYIVMEYVDGITLKQYVRDHGGKLSMEETLTLLGPVIRTLGKVHKAGLVHRDISPDNIMMLPDGTAKLLDFGAVRDVGAAAVDKNLTKSTEAILKPGYAPIEQYLAHGNLGPWTDVYALCGTVFFCLTGQVPPASPERVLGDEVLDLEKELPALSRQQRTALEHGLNIRAEARTASMEALYRELFDIPEPKPEPKPKPKTQPSQAPRMKPKADPKPGSKKKRWALYGLAAVLAVCAILFGVKAINGGKDAPAPSTPPASTVSTADNGNLITGQCGGLLSWKLDPDTGELTVSGEGSMWDFNFYSEDYETYAPWWEHRNQIKSVRIESGVTSVGDYAFKQHSNLTALELPDTLMTIGTGAFDQCAIRELTLPEGLKTIGDSAFSWNPIKTLVIPDSVEYVDAMAFDCNNQLQSVTIGPNTRLNYDTWNPIFTSENLTIRGYTNSMAEDYARILGCNFEAIGSKTWDAEGSCGDQLNWHLDFETCFLKIDGQGDMLDYICLWMAEENNPWVVQGRELAPWNQYRGKIYAVSIGDEVTKLGDNAFADCNQLVDISFGKSLTHLGSSFLNCGFDQIVLPETVTEIDPFTFNYCEKLRELRLPEGLKLLRENAIAECGELQRLYVGKDTVIEERTGLPFTNDPSSGPPPTTYHDLTIISLPGSDAERFAREYNISFKTGAQGMVAEDEGQCGDNVYWFKSYSTLVLYGTGSTWLYGIDDQSRADWALQDYPESWLNYGHPDYYDHRDEITELIVLPGVTALKHRTFDGFSKLSYVDLGTLQAMNVAIQNCPALEEIRLPDTMTQVGEFCLSGNPNLHRVYIENGSSQVLEGCLGVCESLEEVWFSGRENIGNENLFDDGTGSGTAPGNVTFYVKPRSDAERYAKEHNIHYEYY